MPCKGFEEFAAAAVFEAKPRSTQHVCSANLLPPARVQSGLRCNLQPACCVSGYDRDGAGPTLGEAATCFGDHETSEPSLRKG